MKIITVLFACLFASSLYAQPWVDTKDAWLRADIEKLARAGVIKSPITTWPLMWGPIMQDLKEIDTNSLSQNILPVYLRVKKKGVYATGFGSRNTLKLKAANQAKLIRHFGDEHREDAEVSFQNSGVSRSYAWNIELTRALDPLDGEESRYDNSYFSTIWGNWSLTLGAQDRWWGPGWDSSLILSNNARPVPSLSVQRNYSDSFESPWLSWIGPWTFNAFIGQLESDRHVPDAKLLGMSVNFKPVESLEIGLRRTAQWGGDGRPQSISNFIDLFLGRDNCEELSGGCDDRSQEPGNQLAGIDFKWTLPGDLSMASIYGQLIGEDEAGYAPSRKVYQLGTDADIYFKGFASTWYLEYSDTENDFAPNVTYNNVIYQTGYRTEGRSIGSTYDNDTQSLTFGVLGYLKNGDSVKVSLSKIEMNIDGSVGNTGGHSISSNAVSFNRLEVGYQHPSEYGVFRAEASLNNKIIDTFSYQKERFTLAVSWAIEF